MRPTPPEPIARVLTAADIRRAAVRAAVVAAAAGGLGLLAIALAAPEVALAGPGAAIGMAAALGAVCGLAVMPPSLLEMVAVRQPPSARRDLLAAGLAFPVAVAGIVIAAVEVRVAIAVLEGGLARSFERLAETAVAVTGGRPAVAAIELAALATPLTLVAIGRVRGGRDGPTVDALTWNAAGTVVVLALASLASIALSPGPEPLFLLCGIAVWLLPGTLLAILYAAADQLDAALDAHLGTSTP